MAAQGAPAPAHGRRSDAITLRVITPADRCLEAEECTALVVPLSSGGYLGFLRDHAPMVVHLRAGVVRYKVAGQYRRLAISGGFLEVEKNRATILADAAEVSGDIDVARAQSAMERAGRRLGAHRQGQPDIDVERARAALSRAIARLRAAGELSLTSREG